MEDSRVTYETACMLVGTDFQIICPNKGTQYTVPITDLFLYNQDFHFDGHQAYINIQCPTQALVAKWLREIHHLYLEIRFEKRKFNFKIYLMDKKSPNVVDFESLFETYEEALEAALQESLAIIKKLKDIQQQLQQID